MAKEETLLKVSPSLWRNEPVRFAFHIAFILLGLFLYVAREDLNSEFALGIPDDALPFPGLIIASIAALKLLVWWIKSISTRLVVTTKQVVRYEGILSRHMVQMRHGNIQNVYVKQSVFQRLMGCGVVGFSSAGQSDVEIVVDGIPNPTNVASRIQTILDRGDPA